MSQLSLFDELDAEIEKQKQLDAERLEAESIAQNEPVACSHCGELEPNTYLCMINHGLVFNGWCGKRLRFNGMAGGINSEFTQQKGEFYDAAVAWLAEHGWVACDQHDKQFWDMAASKKFWSSDVDYWEKI